MKKVLGINDQKTAAALKPPMDGHWLRGAESQPGAGLPRKQTLSDLLKVNMWGTDPSMFSISAASALEVRQWAATDGGVSEAAGLYLCMKAPSCVSVDQSSPLKQSLCSEWLYYT